MMKLLAGTALAMGMAVSAHAAPVVGTFAAAVAVDTPGFLINVGSTLGLSTGFTTSGTGDLAGVGVGTPLSAITDPFTAASGQSFAFTLNGFGAFSGTVIDASLTPGSDTANRTVRFDALGNFAPTFGGFDAGPSSITGSFTQTGGADAAVSFSFTFASPPNIVPAPAAVALFGLGLAGLGLARRKN